VIADPTSTNWSFLQRLRWSADGLIPAVVQDVDTGEVLMLAWMDQIALRRTLETGQTHFYSRSRRASWHKGDTSGHVQHVASIHLDCDADTILIKASQVGGACHEGYRSCFFRRLTEDGRLEVEGEPIFDADTVYGLKEPQNDRPRVAKPLSAEIATSLAPAVDDPGTPPGPSRRP
jgi:phosphoribosyl-AMP cyclohydrolase